MKALDREKNKDSHSREGIKIQDRERNKNIKITKKLQKKIKT